MINFFHSASVSKKARSPIGTKEVPKTEYCTPIENQQKALILMVFNFEMGNKEVPFNFYINFFVLLSFLWTKIGLKNPRDMIQVSYLKGLFSKDWCTLIRSRHSTISLLWYFVTKIVLTYCEKKIVLVIEKNFWNSRLKAENF